MKQLIVAATALSCAGLAAHAGGIDRSRISYSILFEDGNYGELSFSRAMPEVSGNYPGGLGGGSTGDMAGDFSSLSLSYKHQFSEKLHLGLFVNTPYGADASYTEGVYTGLAATWESQQIAGVLRYEVTPAVSVYGGLRYVRSEAEISLPPALVTAPYDASGKTEDVGYIVGAAFEKPEIALRVALTYESGITHDFPTTESWAFFGGANPLSTTTRIEMPQSLTLDFQSGIAKDTLLFGMIRWSEWSVWEVRPPGYDGIVNDDITSFDNDVITWQLGIGRRLNENLSVFARATYEEAKGGVSSRLSPTDGSTAIGIGGTYTNEKFKVTAGMEYVKFGDTTDGSGVEFEDNTALAFGVTMGFRF